jgi:hypothetical protein
MPEGHYNVRFRAKKTKAGTTAFAPANLRIDVVDQPRLRATRSINADMPL